MTAQKKRAHRCDWQLNEAPDRQAYGTNRCRNLTTKLVRRPGGGYQFRCHLHKDK